MKRTGFSKPSFEDALAKKKQAQKRALERAKKKKPVSTTPKPKKALQSKNKPKKRRKKTDLAKAKEKLWKLCKEIILKRHGNDCYTCPSKDLQGSNCQLGHFISSSVCSTEMRYDLRNLRIQCYACNIHKSGNWPAFEKRLKQDGIDVDYLKFRNEEMKSEMYRLDWYQEKIEHYSALL